MITNPEDIGKIQGGFQKLEDANEKFCAVVTSPHTTPEDHMALVTAISLIGTQKQEISKLLPPVTEP